uniref:Gamma-glutamyltranspeptidase 1 n=1 Tax=Ditylenchus dipsaci TaxID=166011 RepID=A0A915DPL5_9BILA
MGLNWPAPSGSPSRTIQTGSHRFRHGLCSEIGRDVMLEEFGYWWWFPHDYLQRNYAEVYHHRCQRDSSHVRNLRYVLQVTKDSVHGYKAIATPGEIHGYWTVFTKYGSGKRRISGFFKFGCGSSTKEDDIDANEDMKRTFVDPRTGRLLDELAVAPDPVQLFYKEGIAQTIAAEIKDNGGYVIHETPLESEVLPDEMVMCPPPPSSFTVTQAIIGVMAQFYGNKKVDLNDPLVYHRLIETEKFAYAQRTKLGDSSFVKNARSVSRNMTKPAFAKWIASLIKDEAQPINYYTSDLSGHVPDHGTHVTALDHEGHGVSATSTINLLLGSMRVSPTLGIIWNDQMDDFSMPNMSNFFGFAPSPENFILPKKRPMSSMSPMIVYNKNSGKVKMVIGASGGSRIISSVAQTVIRSLLFNQTVKEAVDAPRFHNQFLPHITEYERSIPPAIIQNLTKEHHQNMTIIEKQPSVVQALLVMEDGFIHGNSDFRRKTATYPAGY